VKFRLVSWESKALRCPDMKVDLGTAGRLPKVTLLQMPNGTGKTTSLAMIRAALTGEADKWDPDKIRGFRRPGATEPAGSFVLRLTVDDKPLTIEMNFDFLEGAVKYRTTAPHSGGVMPGWSPPQDTRRFLNPDFVNLFVFDGELAERLLDSKQSEADKAIDALCQLYLLDDIATYAEWDWEQVTKRPGPKAKAGLSIWRAKEQALDKQFSKVSQNQNTAQKRILELDKDIRDLNAKIGSRIQQIAGDRQELERLKGDEQHKESNVATLSSSLMSVVRSPHLLAPAFARGLETLKAGLDKAKLPESSSRQFFVELAQQPECVCGRPITDIERIAIAQHANKYLGENVAGILNALKQDIDLHVISANKTDLKLLGVVSLDLSQAVKHWHQARSAREAHEAHLVKQGGEEVQRQQELLLSKKSDRQECTELLEEIERPPLSTDDEKTICLASLKRQLEDARKTIAEISDTVELRQKTNCLKSILTIAKNNARSSLRRVLADECNERLEKILSRDPVRIEDISQSLVLHNQQGASVGQTLAVGYTFLTSVLHRGLHEFPLLVDSPANPMDNNVRREIGALIPSLCKQFVAFTISSERESFVSAIEKGANGDIRYLTLFRTTKGTGSLEKKLPQTGVQTSTNAVLVEGKDYFFQFDVDDELEES
jgi:DNA sulfur modification protein DndD